MSLFKLQDTAFQAAWSNLAQSARDQPQVLLGAPGGIVRVHARGHEYFVHQHLIAADGKRKQIPLGRTDDPASAQKVADLELQIGMAKALITQVRNLARLGYQVADAKAYGVAAVLYNARLFHEGLTLVGSHAYGVLLNTLGIQAISYKTDDVDLSRSHQLAVPNMDLAQMLAQTGIKFIAVPPFDHREPSTSHKELGISRFRVDLLVPSENNDISYVEVPELNSFATTLPLLDYLLEETFMSVMASRHGVVPVRVPDPARYAIHKLAVSQMRINTRDKTQKDIEQACVLLAMLDETHPGEVDRAIDALPLNAIPVISRALPAVERILNPLHGEVFSALAERIGRPT